MTTETYELRNERWMDWEDVSLAPDENATKPWGQRITGTHPKFATDGEWLQKYTFDGAPHLDTEDLDAGDYIKVSGAEDAGGRYPERKNAYYRVDEIRDDEIDLTRLPEGDVIAAFDGTSRELREQVRAEIGDADEERLEAALAVLRGETGPEEPVDDIDWGDEFNHLEEKHGRRAFRAGMFGAHTGMTTWKDHTGEKPGYWVKDTLAQAMARAMAEYDRA